MQFNFDRQQLETVQLALPTPFTADGRHVADDVLADFVRSRADAGIRVFLPAAGTGEFHSQSSTEIVQCVRATRAGAGDAAVVFAPVGLSLQHAIAIGREAAEAGADALLLMPLVHPYLSDTGFRDYFQALTAAVPLPVVAYKRGPVPGDALLRELAETDLLVGVKYAVNDLDAVARFAASIGGSLGLYCGTAERWAPFFMLAGATGYTSGVGNVCPRLTLAMHRAMTQGHHAQALRLLQIMRPIEDFRARDAESFNISAVKCAVRLSGWNFGPCRPPQRRTTPDDEALVARLLEPILAAERECAAS